MKKPEYKDIEKAVVRIEDQAVRTPLLRSNVLDERVGAKVFIKPENLQRTGSFKFRGAYNALSAMSEEERSIGIIATSSGNHAQGVAAAAKLFGAKATILMPADAPQIKINRTRALGAKVVTFDRAKQDRELVMRELVEKTGHMLVHPFNNIEVIAGQGTIGVEIADDMRAMELEPDRILVCTGGGGLICGVAIAMNRHFPTARINSVEPEGFDDYRRSLEAGKIIGNAKTSGSICDAILTVAPGKIGFSVNHELLSEGLTVSDQEAMAAVKFAFEELKLVVEPGGAVALAAVLKYGSEWKDETIVLTISGGNIDPKILQAALEVA